MDRSIIGSGYVGLVTGACFADVGKASAGDKTDIPRANDRAIHLDIRSAATLVAEKQQKSHSQRTQAVLRGLSHGLCPAPPGSILKSNPSLGNAFRVKVRSTPYSFTPPLS